MNENFQKIIIAAIIIIVIVSGIMYYNQQKAINRLSAELNAKNTNMQNPNANDAKNPLGKTGSILIDQQEKNAEITTKFVEGKVISASGNVLALEADIPDWDKMKEIASLANPVDKPQDAPTYKKTYQVTVNDKTQYLANKLEEIKAGDTISVSSNELVYQTDKLTAVSVVSPFDKPVK